MYNTGSHTSTHTTNTQHAHSPAQPHRLQWHREKVTWNTNDAAPNKHSAAPLPKGGKPYPPSATGSEYIMTSITRMLPLQKLFSALMSMSHSTGAFPSIIRMPSRRGMAAGVAVSGDVATTGVSLASSSESRHCERKP